MTTLLIVGGAMIVLVAVADAVRTTLTAGSGGGPLTAPLGRATWRCLLKMSGASSSTLLGYGGMIVLLLTVAMWVLLLWGGWSLIFLGAGSDELVSSSSRAPASIPATIYYAGFVVFTLGVGDIVATTGTWQVLTALASFIGLFLITLSITYLVSVVSAAVTRRQLAQSITVLGSTGPEIVLTHWSEGQISSQFSSRLQTISTQLLKVTQQHLAYPVLHYFHSTDPASSAPRAIAALDDALVLLDCAVDPDIAPGQDVLGPGTRAMQRYARTVHATGGKQARTPPLPDVQPLRDAGVPLRQQDEYESAADEHRSRRDDMSKVVASDAQPWPT